MLKPGRVRVLGAQVAGAGMRVAMLETDGHAVIGFGHCVRRALPAAADPDSVELLLAEVCAGFDGVSLMGLGDTAILPDSAAPMLAQALGWPVVTDFSAADQRLGGLGAPIEAFFHHAMVRALGHQRPVAVLDLGVVASLTWCDPRIPAPELGCLAFHAGPGLPTGTGALGQVDEARLEAMVTQDWFRRIPPKVLAGAGPVPDVTGLSPADARATLAAGVATAVALGFEHFPEPPARLIVTGEGRHHAGLMAMLAAGCDCPVEALPGLDGDAVAAWALAWLSARVALGLPTTGPRTTGVAAPVGGGTLYQP